ncbi:hypothetical protein RJT34_14448 [Clitoria ternatea]|uniref:Pectinesterase inhibitor domain-containing protein n=1 Tax=Clitoria ternatea TaxID=43366 RepID=A0AAN9JT57_CLITE
MDHLNTKTCLLLISIMSISFHLSHAARNNIIHIFHRTLQPDLIEFCKKTTDPDLCTKTIQPHFPKGGLNPYKALEVEVDATRVEAKKTMGTLQSLLSKRGTVSTMSSSKSSNEGLKICKEQYSSMLDSIKETKAAIAKQDIITAKFKFSAVLSFQASCKDAFQGEQFPISESSDAVFNLGGNCLDIIADIEKATPQKPSPVQSTPSPYSNVIGTIS